MKIQFLIATLLLSAFTSAGAQPWTLSNTIQRALEYAPEMKLTEAEIVARRDQLKMANDWPNPDIDIRIDNQLGRANGDNGYDLNEITINQPIPYKRLQKQQDYAQSQLDVAKHRVKVKQLGIERDIALLFHQWQLADARYALAKQKLKTAEQYLSRSDSSNGKIIRYQTSLEKMRLKIILEQARTSITSEEGKLNEIKSLLAQKLYMSTDELNSVYQLDNVRLSYSLNDLLAMQDNHPQLVYQSQALMSSNNRLQLEKSRVYDDPSISLSRGRDAFDSGEENVYALMFNVQIPLWSNKSPALSQAQYETSQARIELSKIKQMLTAEMTKSHLHLSHLLEQISHHEKQVLVPAKKMYDLTRKGFISGEFSVLTLIDASSTYYDAQQTYLQHLHDANSEMAHLRYAAGLFVLSDDNQDIVFTQGGQ